ncbi:MAG: DNA cytosine methyltransferase [Pseudomonadota bacterium]
MTKKWWSSEEITVDLFAGGGGASKGIRMSTGRDPDIAINHDEIAIAMHRANHPGTKHYIDDIWKVQPLDATQGRPVGLLWASPDCKHFSVAKGAALFRSKEIRALAWVVIKWAKTVKPRLIILENVSEFRTWGPLDSEGRIKKDQKGKIYNVFLWQLRKLGYHIETKDLAACDYGAPTTRKRFFLVARCDGIPIEWPSVTHGSSPGLLPYRTAADIIDWSIPCPSIFERKKPLVEKTLLRIAKGIQRYVIETSHPFILPDIRQTDRAVIPHIQRQFGMGVGHSADSPIGTITAGGFGKTALVSAFLIKYYGGVVGHTTDRPIGTITSIDHHALVSSHLIKLRGTCRDGQSVSSPVPTVTSGGTHIGEVRCFLQKYYSRGGPGQSLNDPVHTLPTKDRMGLVTVMVHKEPYVIADIGMRMLSPRELFRAQGFSDGYQIDIEVNGRRITKTDQVRMCGNSVCPPIAKALVEANYECPLRDTVNSKFKEKLEVRG